jgi:hypothetical protein
MVEVPICQRERAFYPCEKIARTCDSIISLAKQCLIMVLPSHQTNHMKFIGLLDDSQDEFLGRKLLLDF